MEKVNMLLVDDQHAKLLSYQAILDRLGENLVVAKSGREALQCLLKQDVAVILLDVVMPEMDGFETAALIRQHPRLEQTPIIFVTAFSMSDLDRLRGYELGAVDYVFAPVVPAILRAKVSVFVELYRKRRELEALNQTLEQRVMERTAEIEEANEELEAANEELKNEIAERARAEEALLHLHQKNTTILESITDAFYALDRNWRFTYLNREAERILGKPKEELIGKNFWKKFPAVAGTSLEHEYRRALAEGTSVSAEFHNPPPFEAWYDVRAYPSLEGLSVYSREITERKRSEQRPAVRFAITQILAQARTVNEAALGILQFICGKLGLDVGLFWSIDRDAQVLRCVDIWHTSAVQIPEFETISRQRTFSLDTVLPGRVWASGKAVWIADVTKDNNLQRASVAAKEGLNAAFGFPILLGDEVLGVIEFFSQNIRQPDADLLELMNMIGSQIGQFLERQRSEEEIRKLNAELEQRVIERTAQLEAANQELQNEIAERKRAEEALSQQTSILQSILDSMADAVIVVDAEGRLLLFNPAAEQIHGIATTDTGPDGAMERYGVYMPDMVTPYQLDKLPLTRVLRGEVVDTAEMYVRHPKAVNGVWVSANARQLKDENGVVRGGVTVIRDITESKLTEQELRSSREELRNLSAWLQSVREDERTRIAREIHDELGQNLTALRLDLLWLSRHLTENQAPLLEKIQAMSRLTNATARSVQRISMELRPGLLDDLGLGAAIEWQIEQFRERTGIACEVQLSADNMAVDRERATTMFRIFQEILTNIARHSQATKVKIRLTQNECELLLRAKDNGRGISPKEIDNPHSIGLIGMRERVYPWKGKVKIKGISGQGTTVTVSIPLDKPADVLSLSKSQVKSF